MTFRHWISILCGALLLSLAVSADAQVITGSLVGTVLDSSGLAVPEAQVTLSYAVTGSERRAATNVSGDFVFNGLEPGSYAIRVSKSGFQTVEKTQLTLAVGERLSAGTITLNVGTVNQVVSVTAQSGSVVQTASSERAAVVTGSQVENLVEIGRDVKSLAALVPGIANAPDPGSPFTRATWNTLGNRTTSNDVSIDGTTVTSADTQMDFMVDVSQDAVAEVRILVSNYQAEYGRRMGSGLEIITKSGTKQFHGLGSYFKRNEEFNAMNFFDNRNGVQKQPYRYNTWTYNIGGPAYIPGKFNRNKDKLFFFWNQEFWPKVTSMTTRVTMPTDLERAGNFTQSVDLSNKMITVHDPSNGGAAFPGNIIPASRLDPSGVAMLKFFDEPNFFNRSISLGNYNYQLTKPVNSPMHFDTLKLDYNPNSNNFFAASWSYQWDASDNWFSSSFTPANWPQMYSWTTDLYHTAALRYTHVFSPTILNELHGGWMGNYRRQTTPADQISKNQRNTVGYVAPQLYPSTNSYNFIPGATFGGVPGAATIAFFDRFPWDALEQTIAWDDKLSVIRGNHAMKAGVYMESYKREMEMQGSIPFGSIDFGTNVNNPFDTGYAYSNAALGSFNTIRQSSERDRMRARNGILEGFIQDTWKVSRRVTIDYGVRISDITPIYDANNLLSGFDPWLYDPTQKVRLIQPAFAANGTRIGINPVTGTTYPAALIGALVPGVGNPYDGLLSLPKNPNYPRGLTNQGWVLGPRIGFAWDPFGTGKTAVRGGFGIGYDRESMDAAYKPFSGQAPIVLTPTVQYGQLSQLTTTTTAYLFPSTVSGRYLNEKVPRGENFSISVQHSIGYGTVLDLAYVGALGRHLYWQRNLNPVPAGADFQAANIDPTTGKALQNTFLTPIVGYSNINMVEPASSSNYHSMQFSVSRRFAKGLQLGGAWTWSKSMDFNDGDTGGVNTLVPIRTWDYGFAGFDHTHVVKINYVYDLPKLLSGNPFAKGVLNGWQVSGITTFQSGGPMSVGWTTSGFAVPDISGTPSQGARIEVNGNPVLPKSERTFTQFFKTSVFSIPPVGTFGNAGKYLLRGPGINNWNMGVMRAFHLYERLAGQFRWEMYNAFNHTQFTGVNTSASFNAQGQQVNALFGSYTAAASARIMQFALRFSF